MASPVPIVSLRFVEAFEEASALQQGLLSAGIPSFYCAVSLGEGLSDEVLGSISRAPLVIVLGTQTYGQRASRLSTCQALRFVLERHKPIFLVKLCQNFDEPFAEFNLPMTIARFPWIQLPATHASVPVGLVQQIQDTLALLASVASGLTSVSLRTEFQSDKMSAPVNAAKTPLDAAALRVKKSSREVVDEVIAAHVDKKCEKVVQLVSVYGETDEVVAHKGCLALWHFTRSEANVVRLGRAGACEVLVDMLRIWGKLDKEIAEKACESIGLLAKNAANNAKFGHLGACAVVIDVLRVWGNTDHRVSLSACGALSLLAKDETNKRKLKELGARSVVKDSVGHENE
jgi:hypothetical protein